MSSRFSGNYSSLLNRRGHLLLLAICFILTMFFLTPQLYNLAALDDGLSEEFRYFLRNSFGETFKSTLFLCLSVGLVASLIGGLGAVFIRGLKPIWRPRVSFMMLIPLSFPSYVMAFIYAGAFSVGSEVHIFLTQSLEISASYLPRSDSFWLLSLSMGTVLSPYVFLAINFALNSIPKSVLEAAKIFSHLRSHILRKMYIPAILPWWREALLLIAMECIADFGAVAVFNYNTFSLAIYKHWFGMFSLESAREIAVLVIGILFFAILIVKWKYLKKIPTRSFLPSDSIEEHSILYRWICGFFFLFVGIILFALPVLQLIVWATSVTDFDSNLFFPILNSFKISGLVLLPLIIIALVFAILNRFNTSLLSRILSSLSRLGYAVPGSVLAVGCYYSLANIDHLLDEKSIYSGGIFIGSILACIMALCIRFFNVIYTPIETAMLSINKSLDEASMSLGLGALGTIVKVHLPILLPVILNASILLTIDVLKEMPIQLMTRAAGWDSISVKIFEFSSEGEWEHASVYALVLICIGLIPVYFLKRSNYES